MQYIETKEKKMKTTRKKGESRQNISGEHDKEVEENRVIETSPLNI